jgi:hypothetical protein
MMRHASSVATATFLGAVAVLAGCTAAGTPIFILQNQVPAEGCVPPTDLGSFNPRGRIDTAASGGYVFTPVVQNVAEADGVQGLVFVEGADVDLTLQSGFIDEAAVEDDDTFRALTHFSKRFSGTIQPGEGLTSFVFTILPRELLADYMAERLAADGTLVEVQADVKVFGTMNGGDVSTPTFTYWIDVCNGCMKQDLGACADLSSSYTALEGGVCTDLQDTPLECCTAADSSEVCPAEAPTE